MRKFFSLIAAVLFAGSMMASEAIMQYTGGVTTNMVGDGANNAATVGLDADLFTVLAEKGANQNLPGLNKANDIRLYADKNSGNGNTITVSIASGTITSIVLDIKQTATFVVKAGETAVTEEDGAYAINATSFSIQNTTTGVTTQLQLNKITITYESGDVPPTPTMDYYVAGSMTNWGPMAAYKLAANPANEGEYMGEFTFAANDEFKVGYSDGTTIESTNYFPNGIDNNYVITEAGDYTVYFRPDGQGGEDWHYGCIKAIKKEAPAAISCLEVYQKAKNDAVLLNPVTVTYSNGANVWVMDGSASMLIYLPSGFTNNFQAGDVLSGVAGVVDIYQNIVYEVKPDATQAAAIVATPGEAPAPSQAAVIEASDVNKYVILPGFSIEGEFTTDSKTSLPAVLGENTVTIYNNFKFAYTFEAGKTYDIIGVVSAYKGNPQVYFISAEEAGEVVPPTPEHTYTVVGSSAELFGTAWTPSIEDNDMVKQEDGSYKFEKTGLELAAGIIEFKVCEDHAWTNCWPAQNYQLSIAESGIYTITITFDADTKEILASAQKTGDAVVIPSVAMHGNFLGSWADTENFTVAEGDATASLTLNLAAGNYEFGMRIGGSGNWTSNGVAFTRENNAAEVVAGQGNLTLAADVAGDYVFTWTFATNSLAITYPEAPVVSDTIVIDIENEVQYVDYVAAQGWWQFMAENDVYSISISNVSTTQAAGVYTVADLDADYTYIEIKATETEIHFVDGSLTLTEGEDGSRTIEGVLTGDDEMIYSIKLVFRIPTAETTVNVEIPEWGIVDASEYYGFAGYILAGETADKSIYVQLVIPGNNPLGTFTYDDCYANATGIEVAGDYKGIYSMNFTVTAGGTAGAERAFVTADILCYNNTLYHVTTLVGEGINNVEDAVKAIKRIVNGQVVIEKAGKTYNMNGAVIR